MAIQTNVEMWSGDTRVLEFTVRDSEGAVVDLDDYTIYWVLKQNQTSSTVLVAKDSLPVEGGEPEETNGITVTTPASGVFAVELQPEDTEDLSGAYYFEADIVDLEDARSTVSFGFLAIHGTTSGYSYCTLEEAMALMADVAITDNTTPNLATARIIVETIARDIDGVLMGRGVTLPVTDVTALKFLKTVNQYGSCAAIIKSKKPINSGMGGDDGAFGYYETKYKAGLAQLARRSFNLIAEEKESWFAWGSSDNEDDAPFWYRETTF